MEYTLSMIIILVLPVVSALISIHLHRNLVQELIWSQLNGKGTAHRWVAFMDSSPEQLLYPLTAEQLTTIRACSSFERTTAEVTGIRFLEGLLNDYYFTVHYDICGTTTTGTTFTIQEDAYLRVCFRLTKPRIIHWILGSREPF